MDRPKLRAIYKDTQTKCFNKYSKIKCDASTKYSYNTLKNINMKPLFEKTNIEVIKEDTLVSCKNLLEFFHVNKICALNMASTYRPGGGVEEGSAAQEEELFRRTNYFLTLKEHFYRLTDGDVIFSPTVTIIKDQNYTDIKSPFTVSFIASSALKYPDTIHDATTKTEKYTDTDREIMTKAIDNIFRAAYLNKKTVLVLGALGCGAYHNPVNEIIDIYNKCIEKYDKCFEKIVFAVYSKKDKNYSLFSQYIENQI
ncbi:MAG: hypothetical protein Terrestrivirus6_33 [Terrestrivirus sp.]|uniref:Microbial-type PARG catalytic domain-containing protein n=1 Tax=Terrestrivirus sp. TaxID=2487775 RepID=A0A3G4ZNE8_9VIRU|nr:MAG: hypothetical protein Terrestrivirus6_33 [Terrestrivirus sp.]